MIFSIGLFLILSSKGLAQSELWATSNADWHYTLTDNQNINGYTHYTIHRDTIVNGEQAQIYKYVQESVFTGLPTPQYSSVVDSNYLIISLKDSVLYRYAPSISSFDTIIDFAANIGDSWSLYDRALDCSGMYENYYNMELLEKGVTTINGRNLLYYTFEYTHSQLPQPIIDTFYQQLGPSSAFWFRPILICNQIDIAEESFRCYSSDVGMPSEYNYSVVSYACDYFSQVGVDNIEGLESIYFYPNPMEGDYLIIKTSIHLGKDGVMLYDILGREIEYSKCEQLNDGYKIEFNSLDPGEYYLNLDSNESFLKNSINMKILKL